MEDNFTADGMRNLMPDDSGYSNNMRRIIDTSRKMIESRAKDGYNYVIISFILNEIEDEDTLVYEYLSGRGFDVEMVKESKECTEKFKARLYHINVKW